LQQVNDLRIKEGIHKTKLNEVQRAIVLHELNLKPSITLEALCKKLKFTGGMELNFKEECLEGNKTDHFMASSKVLGKKIWSSLDEATKNEIVETLLDDNLDEEEIYRRCKEKWNFNDEIAAILSKTVIKDDGRGSVSLKAIEKILPELEAGYQLSGKNIEDSAVHRAGYDPQDESSIKYREKLPHVPADITNPRVKHALHEVRRLVHAIIRVYGRPAAIHIELSREMKANKKGREKMSKENYENKKMKINAIEELKPFKEDPTEEDVARYIMWKNQNGECFYSGRGIHPSQFLFGSGEIEVDHILPIRRTLDDSKANKVLCFAEENREKGNRTPYEWAVATGNMQKYKEILDRASKFPLSIRKAVYNRVECQELVIDDFVSQHLNSTFALFLQIAF
jgi:CRISPR-associated endonuclease Csn1